jgi:CheY-like chemotaxis protein
LDSTGGGLISMNPNHTILLVEDNPDDVFFMRRALKAAGIENPLVVASDGREAIDYMKGHNLSASQSEWQMPCLIFLDLKLPHLSGHEVLEWLRSQEALRQLVVLVLTTSRERRDIDQAYRNGANAYLVKPSSPPELLQMLVSIKDFWLKYNNFPSVPGVIPGCSEADKK